MRIKKIKKILLIIVTISVIGFIYSYYEGQNIRLQQYCFSNKNIPPAFDNFKIIFITDTHCNIHFDGKDFGKLVDRINALEPDIVLLGGDYTRIDTTYSKPFFSHVKRINSRYGKFSVFGNHDFWEDIEIIKSGLLSADVHLCDNTSYWIHNGTDSIKIGGVGDFWEDRQLLENTTFDVSENNFTILLSHNPDFIDFIEENNKIDLMLSGHTHGGQVTLFGLYAPIMPTFWKPELYDSGQKYRYGWKKVNGTDLYISTGIGLGGFPFRFFAPPEIVEITLKRQ